MYLDYTANTGIESAAALYNEDEMLAKEARKIKRRKACAIFWVIMFLLAIVVFVLGLTLHWKTGWPWAVKYVCIIIVMTCRLNDETDTVEYSALFVSMMLLGIFLCGIIISSVVSCYIKKK